MQKLFYYKGIVIHGGYYMDINIQENGIYLHIQVTQEGDVRLLHGSCRPEKKMIVPDNKARWYRLAELQVSGFDQNDNHGNKHTGCSPSSLMRYCGHRDMSNKFGRKLEIVQEYQGLMLTSHFQFYHGIPAIRCWNTVENKGTEDFPIEYLSSFALTGLSEEAEGPRDQNVRIHIPHNTWFGEAQWKNYTMNELGYDVVQASSMKRIGVTSTGSWACDEYLPMGAYEQTQLGKTVLWQIETSGSWHWEISDMVGELYLQLSGPTSQENGFTRIVKPGETFESVPCAVVMVNGDFTRAIQEMTRYRRAIRRPNEDNCNLPIIFNDYMNCLMGDPTTEKLKPLIDKAAEIGCEYFCIDCGWYDDGPWWDGVGEWQPAKGRFPGGIQEPLQYIREKGMIPGLWLEIEVMGIHCPMVKKVDKSWFFQRNGRPVIDHSRYQLDFRNPQVREYASSVIKRLVEEYGVGYIKMDYNINMSTGTDYQADSPGEGLLSHTRAYLSWLDSVFASYPGLVIENCSSGGMRMEYSHLSRYSIQSVTDQEDYIKMAAIAANCPTACTPEQAAIWSYPLPDGDEEETVYNMVNAMLLRIHQSGYLNRISPQRLALVKEGLQCYRKIRKDIKDSLPFWPLGLASMQSEYLCLGLACPHTVYLAVWYMQEKSGRGVSIPLASYRGIPADRVSCLYPSNLPNDFYWDAESGTLTVDLQPRTARIYQISL